MLKLRIKANVKCFKHPTFDPAKAGGRGGVKGGCVICESICDLWVASEKLAFEIRVVQDRAAPSKLTDWRQIARAELKR